VKEDSLVTLAATTVGGLITLQMRFTDDIVLDSAVTRLAPGPILPDDILVGKAFANQGEHLILRAVASAADTLVYLLDVSPV
jgi:hypothetical protein